jgi:hypothetical protein
LQERHLNSPFGWAPGMPSSCFIQANAKPAARRRLLCASVPLLRRHRRVGEEREAHCGVPTAREYRHLGHVMSALQLLPPQFDAACVTTREISQRGAANAGRAISMHRMCKVSVLGYIRNGRNHRGIRSPPFHPRASSSSTAAAVMFDLSLAEEHCRHTTPT